LSCSDFGYQYTKAIRFGKRPFAPQTIMFVSHGHSEGWMTQTNRDILGKYLAKQVIKNEKIIAQITNDLIGQSENILKFLNENKNKQASLELFNIFWKQVLIYYKPHINVKYVVDYLEPKLLKKYLPILQKSRIVAEPVFGQTELFTTNLAKQISKKVKYHYKLILCLTKEEVSDYFNKKRIPNKRQLEERNKQSAFLHENGEPKLFVGRETEKIRGLVEDDTKPKYLKGVVAFIGRVVGRVRIVNRPNQAKDFKQGDILVAGSTRPEFLPIMEKASAFVTDAGGILSHAAITAREMNKPCIIGTKIATKVFKDGDLVEVDANWGIVRIIK
jgi:phosphohistidine swiveling domain-containing protein